MTHPTERPILQDPRVRVFAHSFNECITTPGGTLPRRVRSLQRRKSLRTSSRSSSILRSPACNIKRSPSFSSKDTDRGRDLRPQRRPGIAYKPAIETRSTLKHSRSASVTERTPANRNQVVRSRSSRGRAPTPAPCPREPLRPLDSTSALRSNLVDSSLSPVGPVARGDIKEIKNLLSNESGRRYLRYNGVTVVSTASENHQKIMESSKITTGKNGYYAPQGAGLRLQPNQRPLPSKPILRSVDSPEGRSLIDATDSAESIHRKIDASYPALNPRTAFSEESYEEYTSNLENMTFDGPSDTDGSRSLDSREVQASLSHAGSPNNSLVSQTRRPPRTSGSRVSTQTHRRTNHDASPRRQRRANRSISSELSVATSATGRTIPTYRPLSRIEPPPTNRPLRPNGTLLPVGSISPNGTRNFKDSIQRSIPIVANNHGLDPHLAAYSPHGVEKSESTLNRLNTYDLGPKVRFSKDAHEIMIGNDFPEEPNASRRSSHQASRGIALNNVTNRLARPTASSAAREAHGRAIMADRKKNEDRAAALQLPSMNIPSTNNGGIKEQDSPSSMPGSPIQPKFPAMKITSNTKTVPSKPTIPKKGFRDRFSSILPRLPRRGPTPAKGRYDQIRSPDVLPRPPYLSAVKNGDRRKTSGNASSVNARKASAESNKTVLIRRPVRAPREQPKSRLWGQNLPTPPSSRSGPGPQNPFESAFGRSQSALPIESIDRRLDLQFEHAVSPSPDLSTIQRDSLSNAADDPQRISSIEKAVQDAQSQYQSIVDKLKTIRNPELLSEAALMAENLMESIVAARNAHMATIALIDANQRLMTGIMIHTREIGRQARKFNKKLDRSNLGGAEDEE